ncbi:MAG: hypothetical protein ACO26G_04785, partial [Rickettsiales bacterium]
MKKIAKQFLIFSLIFSFAGCQKNNNQPTEVRFVDLQGKPKPIKTRVPEANAKIMSGQISHSDNIEANNMSAKNKTNDLGLESYKKNFANSGNSAIKFGVIENAEEASQVDGIVVYAVTNLKEVVEHLNTKPLKEGEERVLMSPVSRGDFTAKEAIEIDVDFADVKGNQTAKRGLEIAAAGG